MKASAALLLATLPTCIWADGAYYCPQNHGYIQIGMTADQVLAACGQPLSKQNSSQPIMRQVPKQQLFYANEGGPTAFYGVWALPVGNTNYVSQSAFGNSQAGAKLQIDVIDNEVVGIMVNNSAANSLSVCGGQPIKIGDPISRVYYACGSPALVNKTYVNQPIPTQQPPQVWIYQPSPYQPTMSMTFADGKLVSVQQ